MGQRQIKKNSYTLFFVLTMLFIVITAMIGIAVFRFYINSFKDTEEKTEYDRYYVMISEDRKASFWQNLYQGAYVAGLEKNVYVDFLGENLASTYTKEELMEIAIASKVNGIMVEADESEEMSRLIDQAAAEGIPVVTVYGDNTHSARCSFVGVGSYNLGREYGRKVLRLAEEIRLLRRKNHIKTAVLVNANAQNSGQNILWSGITETVEKEKNDGYEIELNMVSVDNTNTFSVEESIRDIFMEEELPDIIVCLNELNTTCAYQAVVDYNQVGEVNILGYYDSKTILNAIDRNVIYATISIDTNQMGAFCIDALSEYYELGATSQYYTADIAWIDKNNVSVYMEGNENET